METSVAEGIQRAQQFAEPVSFQLPWGTIRGLRWGNKNVKPQLLLHGWLDNAHSFLPLAAQFLASDVATSESILALDWAGHGHSDHRPAGSHYHFIDYVYDLWDLIDQQQWGSVNIFAHSMGAFIANMLAGIDPEKVANLYAVEAFGLLTATAERTPQDLQTGFKSRREQQQKRRPSYEHLDRAVAARAAAGDFSEPLARLLVERGIEHCNDGKWRFRADGRVRVASPFRLTAAQIGAVLSGIQCPYLLARGAQGFNHIDEHLEYWREAVPQLQIEVFEGGHHVHMEQPQLLWQNYRSFVKL